MTAARYLLAAALPPTADAVLTAAVAKRKSNNENQGAKAPRVLHGLGPKTKWYTKPAVGSQEK